MATPEEHNLDDAIGQSPYSSWTTTKAIAEFHKDKTGPGGVLLRVPMDGPKPEDIWSWEWSPDGFFEMEMLLRGIRIGVEVMNESSDH